MRVCIHRGASEIGGTVVEVEHADKRLVLDLGMPLDARLGDEGELPAVSGLLTPDRSLLAVIVTHGHPDHYGLAAARHPDVPLLVGEATERILTEAAFFSSAGAELRATGYLRDREPIELGPFRVTPFLVDHSAFDAYALLVEAGGCRLFYTGDLRAHGRKGSVFERLLREPPADVDALLLEGTNLRTGALAGGVLASEWDVENGAVELLRQTDGLVLAAYSPQNIDRLVTLYRAAKRSGRKLVIDLYTAAVTRATGRPETIPQADWDGVRVYIPLSQRIKVKNAGEFDRVNEVRAQRIFGEDLAAHPERYVLTFRGSMTRELESAGCLGGAAAVWSMWSGYLEEPSGRRLRGWLEERGIPLMLLHSSGHATVEDLQRLASAVAAKQVVPVHTTQALRYHELYDDVRVRDNGEWWTV